VQPHERPGETHREAAGEVEEVQLLHLTGQATKLAGQPGEQ
jgi:hypothetical protein